MRRGFAHEAPRPPHPRALATLVLAPTAPAQRIAWTNGTELSGTGSSTDSIYALEGLDAGSGPLLAAGGSFAAIGGVPARPVAVWNGDEWSAIETVLSPAPMPSFVARALDGAQPHAHRLSRSIGPLASPNSSPNLKRARSRRRIPRP